MLFLSLLLGTFLMEGLLLLLFYFLMLLRGALLLSLLISASADEWLPPCALALSSSSDISFTKNYRESIKSKESSLPDLLLTSPWMLMLLILWRPLGRFLNSFSLRSAYSSSSTPSANILLNYSLNLMNVSEKF